MIIFGITLGHIGIGFRVHVVVHLCLRNAPRSRINTIDTNIDPYSQKQFVEKTEGKGMKLGDLWDESARMSKIRAKRSGTDPIKDKYLKNYRQKRKGTKHLDDPSRKIEISGS